MAPVGGTPSSTGGVTSVGSDPSECSEVPSDDDALWSFDGAESSLLANPQSVRAVPGQLSAVALDERLIVAYRRAPGAGGVPVGPLASGTVEVNDAGTVSLVGSPRTLGCPAGYVAEYPDVCEFEGVTPETTSGAVLASDLVAYGGEPWLVTIVAIVADVTDRCDTFAGHCFESLPCDCQYQRKGSAVRSELRLTELDSSRTFSLRLRDFPYDRSFANVFATNEDGGDVFLLVQLRDGSTLRIDAE